MAPRNIEALEYAARVFKFKCKAADYDWLEELESEARYMGLDLDEQLRAFADYWSDRPRKPKSYKRAFRNWLANAIKFAARDRGRDRQYGGRAPADERMPTIGDLVTGGR